MVTLTSSGEVAEFVNESQFEGGESGYECVAFSAALCRYAGEPGHGPTGTGEQVDQLADYWYGKLEGSFAASNTNGMSTGAEYTMLQGLGLHYYPISTTGQDSHDIPLIKAWLGEGYPVMICGAETGMHDLDLGDAVPYSWTPTGNHCIVASGIASDGNLLVRDPASIGSTGVRPGPRRYDASKLQLISATAVAMPWLAPLTQQEEQVSINLSIPVVSDYFEVVPGNSSQWKCKQNSNLVSGDILKWYMNNGYIPYCGLSSHGLPITGEVPIEKVGPDAGYPFAHLAGHGIVVQYFERGVVCFDPNTPHLIDTPVGSGATYPLQLYNDSVGTDPAIWKLQSINTTLQAQLTQDAAQITALQAQVGQSSTPDPRIAHYAQQLAAVNQLAQQIMQESTVQ